MIRIMRSGENLSDEHYRSKRPPSRYTGEIDFHYPHRLYPYLPKLPAIYQSCHLSTRCSRAQKNNSLFSISSTFKTNHFLGYTVALNKLDGVYYVDPRPEMTVNAKLREQVRDFQQFLIQDMWTLSE